MTKRAQGGRGDWFGRVIARSRGWEHGGVGREGGGWVARTSLWGSLRRISRSLQVQGSLSSALMTRYDGLTNPHRTQTQTRTALAPSVIEWRRTPLLRRASPQKYGMGRAYAGASSPAVRLLGHEGVLETRREISPTCRKGPLSCRRPRHCFEPRGADQWNERRSQDRQIFFCELSRPTASSKARGLDVIDDELPALLDYLFKIRTKKATTSH